MASRSKLNAPIYESTLYTDIVHADATEDTKLLIGSAQLNLRDVTDDVGLSECATRKLEMKRPSGQPQGELTVAVQEPSHRALEPYYAPPYGVLPNSSRDYVAMPSYSNSYALPPPNRYYSYGVPPYGQLAHGLDAPPVYGQESYGQQKEEKKSKFGGMGVVLVVGAVAGVFEWAGDSGWRGLRGGQDR
ncbi:calcium-dependent lipid-binding (CaLB domain) family protein [Actinidia rufa]|uniref:Calcium-dependent lipid-binding (CaLB domain) family protein n=1 Tax=Actinidia rufa TaxID=165716 RepID=A0A7J0FQY0_9ERIC|nr:calcium-dependent lipid-binding (CaLB domain) family protein [Actinidia rufa]